MATRDLVSLVFTANDKQVQNALTRTGKGLDGLGGQAEKSGGRVQKSFSGAGDSVKGLAGRIPGVGGALGALTSPAGAATAAIGLVVAGIGAAVGKVTSLEKELRPMIQRSNLSAESLQVLSKAANVLGSEDGLDGVTDSAQELQLRLAEASQDASGPAVAAFEKLGLSSADLIAASPEDSFLQVITALQGVTNASDKKFLADELLGGSSEKLSGIINTSSEEFQGLTDSIRENGDIISNEGIADANAFNLALGKLSGGFGQIATQVGTAFIPLLTEIIEGITELWQEIDGPVLQVLGIFTDILGGVLRNAFKIIAGAINIVAGILTGDFSQAWRGIQQVAQGVMNQIILIYNNTIARLPGVSKIDMLTFADNIKIAEDAAEGLAETAATSSETTVRVIGETAQAAEDAAVKVLAAERQLRIDWVKEREKLLAAALEMHKQQVQDRQDALDAEIKAIEEFRERERGFQADQLTELKEQFGVTDVEYRIAQAAIRSLTTAQYAALLQQSEAFGIDDLALLYAHNRNAAQAALTGANKLKEIFSEAHEFIKESGDKGFAAYVAKIEEHLANGVLSVQEAAGLMVEALGTVGDAASGSFGSFGGRTRVDDPGGLGFDNVRGRSGTKGGLDGEEILERLANSPNGMIIDPINGTIHFAGGGKMTRGGGNLRGRDLRDYREEYDRFVAIINGVTVAVVETTVAVEEETEAVETNTEAVEANTEAVEEETEAVETNTEAVEEETEAVETNTAATETATTETVANTAATESNTDAIETAATVSQTAAEAMATFRNGLSEVELRAYDATVANSQQAETLAALTQDVIDLDASLANMAEGLGHAQSATDLETQTLAALTPKVSDLDAGIAEFTKRVLDAEAARKLEADILAGLPPEILTLAKSLGLFGLTVDKVTEDIVDDLAHLRGTFSDTFLESEARTYDQAQQDLQAYKDRKALDDARDAAIAEEDAPSAQHGAIVLPRMGGTRVNVGEAGRAEAIIPLPDLAAMASNLMTGMGGGASLGGGMGSGAGGGREVVLALDGERLGSVFLDQFNILQSENRLLVDLV